MPLGIFTVPNIDNTEFIVKKSVRIGNGVQNHIKDEEIKREEEKEEERERKEQEKVSEHIKNAIRVARLVEDYNSTNIDHGEIIHEPVNKAITEIGEKFDEPLSSIVSGSSSNQEQSNDKHTGVIFSKKDNGGNWVIDKKKLFV